jgi:hypothetical protein
MLINTSKGKIKKSIFGCSVEALVLAVLLRPLGCGCSVEALVLAVPLRPLGFGCSVEGPWFSCFRQNTFTLFSFVIF